MKDDEFVNVARYLAFGVADFDAIDIHAFAYAVVVIVLAIPVNARAAVAFGVHFGVDGFDELSGDGVYLNEDAQVLTRTVVLKEKRGVGGEWIGVIKDVRKREGRGGFDNKFERGRG